MGRARSSEGCAQLVAAHLCAAARLYASDSPPPSRESMRTARNLVRTGFVARSSD